MNRPRTSFRLELPNQSWNITAEDPVRAWAERLAGILQLRRGEIQGSPRLVFKKKGAQRALRVQDSYDQAQQWMIENGKTGKEFSIETRPGSAVRCERFCICKPVCPIMKAE